MPSFGLNATVNLALWILGDESTSFYFTHVAHNFAIEIGTLSQVCNIYDLNYNFRASFCLVKLQNVILILNKSNQSGSQIFLQLVDSHSVKLTCSMCHLGNTC